MKRHLYLGKLDIGDRSPRDVYCTIKLSEGRLSITGVIGPRYNGDAFGGCGQIIGDLDPAKMSYASGWGNDMLALFKAVWKDWHLNDMRAGCEHQRAMGWQKARIDPSKETGWHIDNNANLRQWMYYEPNYPESIGLLCKPCPMCGYKYGNSWLKEELPEWVLGTLEKFPDGRYSEHPMPHRWED